MTDRIDATRRQLHEKLHEVPAVTEADKREQRIASGSDSMSPQKKKTTVAAIDATGIAMRSQRVMWESWRGRRAKRNVQRNIPKEKKTRPIGEGAYGVGGGSEGKAVTVMSGQTLSAVSPMMRARAAVQLIWLSAVRSMGSIIDQKLGGSHKG